MLGPTCRWKPAPVVRNTRGPHNETITTNSRHIPAPILPVEVIRDLSEWPLGLRQGAVAIGNFDGVHLGHAKIVERLLAVAGKVNGPAVVFTFDPHPVRLLRPGQAPAPLTWTERKAELLGELGVDHVIAYPTDEALLQLEPE